MLSGGRQEAKGGYNLSKGNFTVSNAAGVDYVTRKNYISVYEPVKAGAIAYPRDGIAPLTVYFTDTSSGPVNVWEWTFGDGGISVLQHPTHTYVTAGVYTVSLTVMTSAESAILLGGSDSVIYTNYITAAKAPPQVDFIGTPRSGDAPLDAQFTSIVTGDVTSYAWAFGDGGVASAPNPTHTYTGAGSFSVTLVVTGPGGTAQADKPGYITVSSGGHRVYLPLVLRN
ncbi:MAG: PKD domain-containing protein [Anaerolineae bacterium]|nr:PKD domain-containing protein [Anaerolineae bacterium]